MRRYFQDGPRAGEEEECHDVPELIRVQTPTYRDLFHIGGEVTKVRAYDEVTDYWLQPWPAQAGINGTAMYCYGTMMPEHLRQRQVTETYNYYRGVVVDDAVPVILREDSSFPRDALEEFLAGRQTLPSAMRRYVTQHMNRGQHAAELLINDRYSEEHFADLD